MANRVNLLDECARILNCSVYQLRRKIVYQEQRTKLIRELFGRRVQTTYEDRNGVRKIFTIGGLTRLAAAYQPAYGNLAAPFNVSISAHFYARHRIRLAQPYLPCAVEQVGISGALDNFYPLELLELIPENTFTVSQLFTNEETDEDSELDVSWGKNELSQEEMNLPCLFCGEYH